MARRSPLLLVLLVALPALAIASGGDAQEAAGQVSSTSAVIRHSINLAILVGGLWAVLKRPVGDFLKFRRNEVKEQLDVSAKLKGESDAKYQELQNRLEHFDDELSTMMAAVAEEAELERKSVAERARQSAAQLDAATLRTIEEEMRRAQMMMQTTTVELSVQLAETLLRSAVQPADQQRLTSDYLGKVKEAVAS